MTSSDTRTPPAPPTAGRTVTAATSGPTTPDTALLGTPSLPRRAPLVLLVDDERGLSLVLGRALARSGYDVSLAVSGTDALAQLALHRDVAAVVTDRATPTTNGRTLADEVLRRHPGVPLLVLTEATSRESAIDRESDVRHESAVGGESAVRGESAVGRDAVRRGSDGRDRPANPSRRADPSRPAEPSRPANWNAADVPAGLVDNPLVDVLLKPVGLADLRAHLEALLDRAGGRPTV